MIRIAECQEKLGETDQAINFFQKFLATAPTEKRRHEVEHRLDMLKVVSAGGNAPSQAMAPGPEFAQIAYKAGEDAYREGKMADGEIAEDTVDQMRGTLGHAPTAARRAEATSFAGEGDEDLVRTVHLGEAEAGMHLVADEVAHLRREIVDLGHCPL